MENSQNSNNRSPTPRRRKRSRQQIFKETYLPAIILLLTLVLIIVFVIGSITRSIQRKNVEKKQQLEASVAASVAKAELDKEAASIAEKAAILAASYDYENAIKLIDSFSEISSDYPQLAEKRGSYEQAQRELVLWEDPSEILNLSTQMLIADPTRAFTDQEYGASYNKNFITLDEFRSILQQLYENGYILISMDDITNGTQAKDLYLPNGKKPFMLTQTQVNYYTYMTDSDGDRLPDAGGDGFASKLILDENGKMACEMVDSSGNTITGAYDLVPILEAFIEEHPDFSYKGARAILAVTGYNGIFGYRTNPKAVEYFGADVHEQAVADATAIVSALRNAGYEIACCTYENAGYGSYSTEKMQSDLSRWLQEVSPIVGVVDTFAFARNSDIADKNTDYSGDKFTVLSEAGFTHYLGFSTNGAPWLSLRENYVRQGRLLLTGSNLTNHPNWFDGLFDPVSILDPARESISS